MDELAQALATLKQEWTEKEGKTGLARLKRQQALEQLRMRVEAAKDAIVTHDAAEVCATELESIKADIAERLDIQLGGLLAKRAIKAGEIVGSWQGPRRLPSGLRSDQRTKMYCEQQRTGLTKGEFIKGVKALGLLVGTNQEPVTGAALGKLFDAVDTDGSKSLDLKEATTALKRWEADGKKMYASQAEKTKQLATLRTRAGRKLQVIGTAAGQVVHVLTASCLLRTTSYVMRLLPTSDRL